MSNHFGPGGKAWMVDVSGKTPTQRRARAEARVRLGPALAARVADGAGPGGAGTDDALAKGDVLGVARLAGIAAVKRVPDLIPLAHPLAIHHAAVDLAVDVAAGVLVVTCEVVACERTGVEMEAMTGASVAALAVYDMCKGQDKGIVIEAVRLLHKSGGRSGTWDAPGEAS
jgi:cyclic pyranopterin phosphate synthase